MSLTIAFGFFHALTFVACGPTDVPDHRQQLLVLKCHLQGVTPIAGEDDEISNLLSGEEGIQAYFQDISYGRFSLETVVVSDWVTLEQTEGDDLLLDRRQRINNCIQAHHVDPSDYGGVLVFRDSNIDAGSASNVLLDHWAWNVTFATHELGHWMGLEHSFDMSQRQNAEWSAPGEYFDYWDIMSAMSVYSFDNSSGVTAGPDMDAAFKMRLGWISEERIERHGMGELNLGKRLSLSRYDRNTGTLPLVGIVSIPDSTDYYTVEYRPRAGWDRAIPRSAVMVHKIENGTPYLVPQGDLVAGDVYLSPEKIKVKVESIDDVTGVATLELSRGN